MSSPNARICNTPNCHRLATKSVAGLGEWCQTCYFLHFPIPSRYHTHNSNLPSIYHLNNLRNIQIPQVPPPINIPGVPPPIQIPQMPPHIQIPQVPQAANVNVNPVPNYFIPTPPSQHFFGLWLRGVRFYGGRRKGKSK